MNENSLHYVFATVAQTLATFVAFSGGFVLLGRQRLDADRLEAQANLRNVRGLNHAGILFHLRRLAQTPMSFLDRQDRVAEVLVQAGAKRVSAEEQEEAARATVRIIHIELAANQLLRSFWVSASFGVAGIAMSLAGLCLASAIDGTAAGVVLVSAVLVCSAGAIAGAGVVLHFAAGRMAVNERATTHPLYAWSWPVIRSRFGRFCRDTAGTAAARAEQRWPTGYRRAAAEWTTLRERLRTGLKERRRPTLPPNAE